MFETILESKESTIIICHRIGCSQHATEPVLYDSYKYNPRLVGTKIWFCKNCLGDLECSHFISNGRICGAT